MAKYTKQKSAYIKRHTHQTLKNGSTIFERDWSTVGGRLNFGSGKVPYYTVGNFIYTVSPSPFYQKKHKNGSTVGVWTYDDVEDAKPTVNEISVDEVTEDIRSFAYYGSCVELVRVSIENIIKTFPGNITVSNEDLEVPPKTETDSWETVSGIKLLNNPFEIDLYHDNLNAQELLDNELKYLACFYGNYVINDEEITSVQIESSDYDEDCPMNNEYTYRYYNGKGDDCHVLTVTINGNYKLYGYQSNYKIIFGVKEKELEIKPKEEIIEKYFDGLTGFEKTLLNRKSTPLYTNSFVTPLEYNQGFKYYNRTYTWPSKNGYCIDVLSPSYISFVNKLVDMAELYDKMWTDNIWRRMTHEAIKNYDWTYTREFSEGDEEENIEGGERMHKVLNVIGRVFDEAKRYIDLIKHRNRVTYNQDRNMPNALLSDKLEETGFEVFSTIPVFEKEPDENEETENGEEVENNEETDNKVSVLPTVSYEDEVIDDSFFNDNIKWYETRDNERYTFADVDVEFMRRLILSSKHILKTKGTKHAIEMIMAMFGYGIEDEENEDDDESEGDDDSENKNKKGDFRIEEYYHNAKARDYEEEVEDSPYGPLGDTIIELNRKKNIDLLYYDDASGIPVGSYTNKTYNKDEKKIVEKTYVIPYYSHDKLYDGEFYFQSKGGWLKRIEKDSEEETEEGSEEVSKDGTYEETLSYLHVVPTIGDLFNVNPFTVDNGDIYYVVNVSDYNTYSESEGLYSNFFVVKNVYYVDRLSGWESIDMSTEEEESTEGEGTLSDEEKNLREEKKKLREKALYLNSIIPDNIGNNPHVGYGYYDDGNEYIEYMKNPFKYAVENKTFNSSDDQDLAESITFEIGELEKCEDNTKIFDDTVHKPKNEDNEDEETEQEVPDSENEDDKGEETEQPKYRLDSKVICIINNIDNEYYKQYFKKVILKYITQVVPSTTIIKLVNF